LQNLIEQIDQDQHILDLLGPIDPDPHLKAPPLLQDHRRL
jgi:hypothetical protein